MSRKCCRSVFLCRTNVVSLLFLLWQKNLIAFLYDSKKYAGIFEGLNFLDALFFLYGMLLCSFFLIMKTHTGILEIYGGLLFQYFSLCFLKFCCALISFVFFVCDCSLLYFFEKIFLLFLCESADISVYLFLKKISLFIFSINRIRSVNICLSMLFQMMAVRNVDAKFSLEIHHRGTHENQAPPINRAISKKL